MTTETIPALPSRRAVMAEQVRAVGIGLRLEIAAALLVGVAATAAILVGFSVSPLDQRDGWGFAVSPVVGLPAVLVALFLPLLVWRGEGVARRDYLWAMPMDRGWAHAAKAGAGWAWAMGLLTVYLLGLCAIALALGGEVGVSEIEAFSNVPESIVPPRPGATVSLRSVNFYRIVAPVPAWQWLVPFVAVTLAYLFGSAVAIAARYPIAWGVVVWAALMFVVGLSESNLETPARVASAILEGRYGLATALTGEVEYFTSFVEEGRVRLHSLSRVADGSAWLGSVLLWGAPVVALFFLAARRRRER